MNFFDAYARGAIPATSAAEVARATMWPFLFCPDWSSPALTKKRAPAPAPPMRLALEPFLKKA
eukprot:CAMPEP_0173418652 /NCGR_PEP_ID=MMETSP1357-20121228/740_1 /TAXON_ID=77926 /ORGANISM="Hemiselmis rufescens, Strain PCC563" /LENGTH=62 /DNA_ID=CAMNT_0014381177 /DNA_START=168 /DNA_END=356 /DNA_ORIENTATION=+